MINNFENLNKGRYNMEKLMWEHLYRVISDIGSFDFDNKEEAVNRAERLNLLKCNAIVAKFW